MANELNGMSKKQLVKLRRDVDKALAGLANKEKKEAKKAAEKAAAKFGYSLSELTGGAAAKAPKRQTRKSPKNAGVAKYANPDDGSQTWTGKGRQPAWYKAAVDAGKSPASMEI